MLTVIGFGITFAAIAICFAYCISLKDLIFLNRKWAFEDKCELIKKIYEEKSVEDQIGKAIERIDKSLEWLKEQEKRKDYKTCAYFMENLKEQERLEKLKEIYSGLLLEDE